MLKKIPVVILVENEKPSEIYNIDKKKNRKIWTNENKFIYDNMIELSRISSYVPMETLLCAV